MQVVRMHAANTRIDIDDFQRPDPRFAELARTASLASKRPAFDPMEKAFINWPINSVTGRVREFGANKSRSRNIRSLRNCVRCLSSGGQTRADCASLLQRGHPKRLPHCAGSI
jgi:hypothetical protein